MANSVNTLRVEMYEKAYQRWNTAFNNATTKKERETCARNAESCWNQVLILTGKTEPNYKPISVS